MGIFSIKRIDMRRGIYGYRVSLVGSIKDHQFILPSRFKKKSSLQKAFTVIQEQSAVLTGQSKVFCRIKMENCGIDKLVVHLERSMDLLAMEHGVKLIGTALAKRTLNSEWTKTHSVRDIVETVRSLALGVERRKAGAVKGSVLPLSMTQRQEPSLTPHRDDVIGCHRDAVSQCGSLEVGDGRQSVIIHEINAEHSTPSGGYSRKDARRQWMASSLSLNEACDLKMRVEP
ncbi:hypothetical protein ACFX2I_033946 [Malus domestica]